MGRTILLLNCEDAEKWKGSWKIWEDCVQRPGDVCIRHNVYEIEDQPTAEAVAQADLVVISGSHYSAYEDLPWINRMVEALPQWVATGTRIIACCFGHQLMARALGGKVEKNPGLNFVLGVETIRLKKEALEACGLLEAFPGPLKASGSANQAPSSASQPPASTATQQGQGPSLLMVESHGDCVTKLPPGAVLIADSATAAVEMFVYGPNVLSFQFHPELSPETVLEKIFPFVGPQGNKRLSEEEAAVSHTQLTTVKPHVDVMLGAMHYFADHGSKLEAPSGKGAGEGAGPVQPALAPHPVHDPLSKVVGHTREALQAGLQQVSLQCDQLSKMNSVAAHQYNITADAAEKLANKTEGLQARVAPVKKALAGLAALEAQVDALGGLMGHLEMESKVLARQVGVE